MQDSTVQGEVTVTGRPRNLKEVLRVLKRQRGSIFFEKTLARSNAQNLHNSKTCLAIPLWFFDSHCDQFRDIVYLVAGPTTRTWTVRLYIPRANYMNEHKARQVKFCQGWNEFATFHGLVKNDRLIFSLKAISTFEVYIFHRTGEPKESSFSTSREPSIDIHELLPKKGYKKLEAGRATKLEGKGMIQLGKDLVRKYNHLNARRKEDIIHFQKPLDSALDIFEPVMGQEPGDDVHLELLMPFTKSFAEMPQDIVETKITCVGFEDKNQAQLQSQTLPPSFFSPSTFRNLNSPGGNLRVQTVVVLNGIPEINGEAGDGASSTLSIVQSNFSAVVQSTLFVLGQSDPAVALPSDPLTIAGSDPPALVQPKIEELVNSL